VEIDMTIGAVGPAGSPGTDGFPVTICFGSEAMKSTNPFAWCYADCPMYHLVIGGGCTPLCAGGVDMLEQTGFGTPSLYCGVTCRAVVTKEDLPALIMGEAVCAWTDDYHGEFEPNGEVK
jgi:hypothetical protein